jgi:hypothetical protein
MHAHAYEHAYCAVYLVYKYIVIDPQLQYSEGVGSTQCVLLQLLHVTSCLSGHLHQLYTVQILNITSSELDTTDE